MVGCESSSSKPHYRYKHVWTYSSTKNDGNKKELNSCIQCQSDRQDDDDTFELRSEGNYGEACETQNSCIQGQPDRQDNTFELRSEDVLLWHVRLTTEPPKVTEKNHNAHHLSGQLPSSYVVCQPSGAAHSSWHRRFGINRSVLKTCLSVGCWLASFVRLAQLQ